MKKNLILAGLIALTFLFTGSGCSFVFMKSPPENYAVFKELECTESIAAPVADTIFAAAAGVLSLALYISSSTPDPDAWLDFSEIERGVAGIMLVSMLVHGTSAIYGYVNANKCKRAKTGYEVVMSPVPRQRDDLGFRVAAQDADGQPQ